MRTLGIDYGDSRCGLAITDELGITAQGLETIYYKGNDKVLLSRLDEIIETYNISTIVVGMPFSMDGSKTERARITEGFVHKLKCKYKCRNALKDCSELVTQKVREKGSHNNNINIYTMDERLTTIQAQKTMNELNINKKKKKDLIDTISAVYILESYINKI